MTAEIGPATRGVGDLLRQLDDHWQRSRPLDIRHLVEAARGDSRIDDWVDLLAADLEWRLRVTSPVARSVPRSQVATGDRLAPPPKRVEEYLAEFPEVAHDLVALRGLVESEFIALSRWHDPPKIADFVTRFSAVPDLEVTLREALDEVQKIWAVFVDMGLKKVHFLTAGQIEIGRQHGDEPPAPFLADAGKRLIVVDRALKKVSRRQAMVTRTALATIELTNTSKSLPMNVSGERLRPGATMQASLPASIGIQGSSFRFELAT
jgi:hypothetical protein